MTDPVRGQARSSGKAEHETAVRRHVAAVGAALNQRLGGVVHAMREVLASRIEELDGDPALLDLLGASIEGNVDTILHALQHEIRGGRIEPPTAAFEYARRLAQRGVPVNALVRAYRLGQQFLLRQAFDVSQEIPEQPEVRADAYDRIVHEVFDYIDWISQQVVTVYEDERESWLANRSNARDAKVRELLEGPDLDLDAAEQVIGYRIRGHHVAVVAWMEETAVREDQLSRFTRAIRSLSTEIGNGQAPLILGCDRATTWAWVPVAQDYRFDRALAAWSGREVPVPMLALGSRQSGLDGFRRSHRQAQRVHHVALLQGRTRRAVLSHDEPGMAVTALLAQDLDATRAWVHDVLGELAGADEAAERHRETLLMFLRHQGSFTATAEAMVMHKNSIKYRVAGAEKMLGYRVPDNRLDVEVALTAFSWLGDALLG